MDVHASPIDRSNADLGKALAPRQKPRGANNQGVIVNALTVDVEDYFQVEAFAHVIPRHAWDAMPARVEANTEVLLDLFAEAKVFGTFFLLGWVAERFPHLVRRIARAGHEIASHGHAHERISILTRDQFRADIRRAKSTLEDLGGMPVLGYRAPTFSIGEKTWWAYEILGEEGYAYSSSLYPISHDLYGMPAAPRVPFYPITAPILEIPLTTTRLFNRNFPSAGGGYFRLLPYAASRWAMRRVNRIEHNPCIFYCHPWEFDPDQPRIEGAGLKSRLRHYTNLRSTRARLTRLLMDFSWGRMDEVFLHQSDRQQSLRVSTAPCPA